MLYAVLFIMIIVAGYFIFRYYTIVYAIRKTREELDEIQQDFTRNQILHLPMPDKSLGKLLISVNSMLSGINKERQIYEKREKEFQKQIENISHDLRTPLTVIIGYLKLLEKTQGDYLADNQELKDTLDIIEHKAGIMKNLIGHFYDYSRLNADDYKISLSAVDVSRALRESLLGNYHLLENKKLQIQNDIPDNPIWVLGEQSALDRIFQNLFQNAERYADSTLNIGIREEDKSTIISFTNDTCMLSKEDVPHLFERFYMQDVSRKQDGTGLGLTVAKALAEEMEGTLRVNSIETADKENPDKEKSDKKKLIVCFELTLKAL